MGEFKGFLKYKRQDVGYRPVEERVKDFNELSLPLTPDEIKSQTARCMSCGVPFCHGMGCPLGNRIPEFNELVYKGRWKAACENLHSTNNFPEITGRVCPALCEAACCLGINDEPVLVRHIEYQIVEKGFEEGWIKPLVPATKTGKRVAVIGSGPAGLAAAQQLARSGHEVFVFEKDSKPGGLLRYGIPDFKLEKRFIDRRLEQMRIEGVEFRCGIRVGEDVSTSYMEQTFDAIVLTMGAGKPRELQADGADLDGVHYAWDYLTQQNKKCNDEILTEKLIDAGGKNVVVIGGGDTGSDCVGTARRQGAKNIYQLEILPKPPEERAPETPWPMWPKKMRSSSSHEEGCERMWSVMTRKLVGENGKVKELHGVEVDWFKEGEDWKLKEKSGSEFVLDADLVLLAMGYVHVFHEGIVKDLELELDKRGNINVNNYQTSQDWVFAAGDSVEGASLVVRAIKSGREAAAAVDEWLMGGEDG